VREADAELPLLARRVVSALRAAGETLATAESCTGGMIAALLTTVPGASNVFWGGCVVYNEEAKIVLTDLDPELLRRHGPVSAPTTEALAAHVRRRARSTYGLAVTGWAGPTADDGAVGEVHGALSHRDGVLARAWHFDGDRDAIRRQAAAATLSLLREHLESKHGGAHD
jgi:PncC family amidohydrolase